MSARGGPGAMGSYARPAELSARVAQIFRVASDLAAGRAAREMVVGGILTWTQTLRGAAGVAWLVATIGGSASCRFRSARTVA